MSSLFFRVAFSLYWLAFALLTARQGQFPGLIAHPERWEYPYKGVALLWGLLAALLVPLYVMLTPAHFPYSWRRLGLATLYAASLFAVGIAPVGTDLPGLDYVPAMFGFATLVAVLSLAVVSVAAWLLRKRAA